jgi:tartrate-resistant acid phosphatase type 5
MHIIQKATVNLYVRIGGLNYNKQNTIKIAIGFLMPMLLLCCTKAELITPKQIEITHKSDSVVFAVIGDYGLNGDPEKEVSDLVKSWDPDLIITTGDNNYWEGDFSTLKENISSYYSEYIFNFDAPSDYQCNGKAFKEKINRFFPCPGNHDDSKTDHLVPYLNFFTLLGDEINYSFIWGPVHFFSLNSLPDDVTNQKEWLKTQLAKSNSGFNVVYFHHSPYSQGQYGNKENMQWNFQEMGADIVLTGHDHLYTRVEKKGEESFHYLVNGAGGCNLYSCSSNILDPKLFSVFCYDNNFGAIRGKATPEELVLEFISISDTSVPVDRVVIKRASHFITQSL